MDEALRDALVAWDRAGLTRTVEGARGRDLCSNDYLGLARDPRLAEAAADAIHRHGVGAGAARLLGGHTDAHAAAEAAAARWQRTEAALLFPSGYHANLAVVTTLAAEGDLLLSDERNHASLIDGARLSKATVEVFRHDDPDDLARRLAQAGGFRRRIVAVESVNSMTGTLAPLEAYAALAVTHDARLVVDEAHAAGLYGPGSAGLATDLPNVAARTITGGKALGVAGAFVVGDRDTIQWLENRARPFVFTTAPMPALAAALEAAIEVVSTEPWLAEDAHHAARYLRARLAALGLEAGGASPIVPVRVGAPEAAVRAATAIQHAGFDVRAVRPPTVPPGESGLRIVCRAGLEERELDRLAEAIARAVPHAATPSPATVSATPLVVVGTDTDVGKTVVSALLVRAAMRAGRDARYLKPVQTGSESDTDTVVRLSGLGPESAPPPGLHLERPASVDQAAKAAGHEVGVDDVVAPVEAHLRRAPEASWVLETAGGLLVPLSADADQASVLRRLGAPCVLVARSGLGTLNHTLLTVEAMRRRGLSLSALFLVGPHHPDNVQSLRTRLGALPILEVPRFAPLETAALDAWLDAHAQELPWR